MTTLIEKSILNERLEKSRSGTYADTSENRRKHRVGQKYGSEKKEEEKPEKTSSNEKDPAKELEAVNKVIAAINEGKLRLPQEEIMVLVEKKNNLELAKRQAEKIHSGVKANEEKRNAAEAKETSKKINEAQKEEEKPSLSKEKLESAKDGSSITIKNAQTKNTVISYTKKDGQWFSKNSMTRGEVKASPEQVSKTVEGYNRKTYLTKIDLVEETKSEPKQEASGQASEADKEDLREARKKLAYLQDNEERLIKRDGKEKYEERLKQAKDEVAKLKGEEPQEETKSEPKKEESRGEKKTDKASDPIYQVQQKKKEASKKYDSKREEARQKYDKEADEIRSEIDKLYESDHPDAAKKRKELWNTLKEKTNKYDAETTRLKDEYEAEYKKLDEAEDKLYDQRQKEETSEEVKESYTRVKFEDVPNSGKINLKKYLSEKVRKGVDEKWSNIKNIPTENLKKMEKGLVNDLNKNFEAIKKSQRAELLYSIMKVKGELEKRGKESQKKE